LRTFLELVPFSVTLVKSHSCTLLKLLHHGIMVTLRRLDFSLGVLRDVHLFLIVLVYKGVPSSLPTSLGAISLLA
jgi:hypothetical protein